MVRCTRPRCSEIHRSSQQISADGGLEEFIEEVGGGVPAEGSAGSSVQLDSDGRETCFRGRP